MQRVRVFELSESVYWKHESRHSLKENMAEKLFDSIYNDEVGQMIQKLIGK